MTDSKDNQGSAHSYTGCEVAVEVDNFDDLDGLVSRFSIALLGKLRAAANKGRSGWDATDWKADCQSGLARHVAKGDPLDVAAYAAFCWHHGWPTMAPDGAPAQSAPDNSEGWREDPSADERWNLGLDFGMNLLCDYLGVDKDEVIWDAATETVEGDVSAVIGNILRMKFGEDWSPRASGYTVPADEIERLRAVAWAAQGMLNADTYVSDIPREQAVREATLKLQRALGTWQMHHTAQSAISSTERGA